MHVVHSVGFVIDVGFGWFYLIQSWHHRVMCLFFDHVGSIIQWKDLTKTSYSHGALIFDLSIPTTYLRLRWNSLGVDPTEQVSYNFYLLLWFCRFWHTSNVCNSTWLYENTYPLHTCCVCTLFVTDKLKHVNGGGLESLLVMGTPSKTSQTSMPRDIACITTTTTFRGERERERDAKLERRWWSQGDQNECTCAVLTELGV